MQSNQAKAAREIRELLKSLSVPAKVSSKGYSMGDHVNVDLTNQPPKIVDQIKKLTGKYQYGHFDGMIDLYEYSNTRDDIPQTKYLFVNNEFDEVIKKHTYKWIKQHYAGMENAPAEYDESHNYWNDNFKAYGSNLVYRILCDTTNTNEEFWQYLGIKNEPLLIVENIQQIGDITIGTIK